MGVGLYLCAFLQAVYLIVDWEQAKSGFFLYLKGVGLIIVAGVLAVVIVPNYKAAQAMQRVHARERATATAPDKEQPAGSPIEKSQPLAAPVQKKQPAANPSHQALRLQGISYHPTRPSAIINGNTLFVGEKAADWTITAISNQSVTLQDDNGQTNILSLR